MIINSNDSSQRNILTNKCYYQTTAQIMHDFEQKGYANSADETAKVITAYHNLIQKNLVILIIKTTMKHSTKSMKL